MRRILMIAVACATFSANAADAARTASAVAKSSAPAVDRGGWPDTRSGALARRWVEAFSKGEKAMRATLPEILAPESLAKTGMDERMERYHALQDKLGALMLVKIEKSSPEEVVAVLAASDFSQH